MWGLRLVVWKFHVRAPPDWYGKEERKFFGSKTARTLILMERNNSLEGFYLFFFLLSTFFFPSFKHPIPEKGFFYIMCHPRVAKAIHTSLLWVFNGAQSSPTLPTYHHPFKPQQKSGTESRLPPGCLFFCLFFSFLSCQGSFLILFLWERERTGVSRISFLFLCVAYHTITYLGEHNFYLLCVWIISCRIGGRRLERTSPDRG